jgi:hypothetical protein
MFDRMRQKQKKLRAEEASMQRDRMALGLSLVTHACVLGLFAVLVRPIEPLADEAALVAVGRFTIVHRVPPPRRSASTRPAATPRPIALAAPLHERVLLAAAPVPRDGVAKSQTVIERAVPEAAAAATAGAGPVVVPSAVPTSTPTPLATPAAPPTVPPTPSPAVHVADVGEFASSYPPTPATPELYNAIRANVVGHVHAHVHVDEHGHATAVEFLVAPADNVTTDDLRQKLLTLTYVPAECNGLPCAGTFDART